MIITIANDVLQAQINRYGAELVSITKNGEEYIWEGDPKYWKDHSPVLFPMASSLLDKKYTHNGETYGFPQHGFARDCMFDIVKQTESSVVLRLVQNHLTQYVYPFEYDFCVSFELKDNMLDVNYIVKNLSAEENLYFNTGAHEGYKLFDGGSIEDHYIEFEKEEKLIRRELIDPVWRGVAVDYGQTKVLELSDKLFEVDGAFFLDIESKYVILRSKKSDKAVKVNFDCTALGFWKVVGGGYICIEPWDGFCPFEGDGYELKEKRFIQTLAPKSEYVFNHSIEIL